MTLIVKIMHRPTIISVRTLQSIQNSSVGQTISWFTSILTNPLTRHPYVSIYKASYESYNLSYNKSQRDALFLKFIS